jgi:hypothetical protein
MGGSAEAPGASPGRRTPSAGRSRRAGARRGWSRAAFTAAVAAARTPLRIPSDCRCCCSTSARSEAEERSSRVPPRRGMRPPTPPPRHERTCLVRAGPAGAEPPAGGGSLAALQRHLFSTARPPEHADAGVRPDGVVQRGTRVSRSGAPSRRRLRRQCSSTVRRACPRPASTSHPRRRPRAAIPASPGCQAASWRARAAGVARVRRKGPSACASPSISLGAGSRPGWPIDPEAADAARERPGRPLRTPVARSDGGGSRRGPRRGRLAADPAGGQLVDAAVIGGRGVGRAPDGFR